MNTTGNQTRESDSHKLLITRMLDHPIERVWEALTNREQMKEWYFELDEFKPEPGFRFSFTGEGTTGIKYIHRCIITEVIPQKKLQYSWVYEGYAGYSLVTFELSAVGHQTQLTLSHEGVETFPQDEADFNRANFSEGWNYIVGISLPGYLDKQK